MSCACGCNKVEDYGSETFCTECGSLVKQDFIAEERVNSWDQYQHQQLNQSTDVANKYASSGIFDSSKDTYLKRQRRVRLDKLVNLCQKLNLPCPNLVAETALLMLDKDLADSRKNITQKLMGAAIYTSCKFHSIQITSKEITQTLEITGKHLSTFFVRYHKTRSNLQTFEDHQPQSPPIAIQLADVRDLETNGVIPPHTAQRFFQLCSDLSDLFTVQDAHNSRIHSSFFYKNSRYRLAVYACMVNQHLYDKPFDTPKYRLAGIENIKVKSVKKDVASSWHVLYKTCCLFMRWVLKNGRSSAEGNVMARNSRSNFPKLLDKLLQENVKSRLVENIRKYREFGSYKLSKQKHCIPSTESSSLASSSLKKTKSSFNMCRTACLRDNLVDSDVLDQCMVVLGEFIVFHHPQKIIIRFTQLLTVLSLTEMKLHLPRLQKQIYFVLLHQIILAMEPHVPPLSQLLNEKDKAEKVDEMIRKTFIKTFVKHEPYMLPLNLDLISLTASIHTFYGTVTIPCTFKKLLRRLSADADTEPLTITSSSSAESSASSYAGSSVSSDPSSSYTSSSASSSSIDSSNSSSTMSSPQGYDVQFIVPEEIVMLDSNL